MDEHWRFDDGTLVSLVKWGLVLSCWEIGTLSRMIMWALRRHQCNNAQSDFHWWQQKMSYVSLLYLPTASHYLCPSEKLLKCNSLSNVYPAITILSGTHHALSIQNRESSVNKHTATAFCQSVMMCAPVNMILTFLSKMFLCKPYRHFPCKTTMNTMYSIIHW